MERVYDSLNDTIISEASPSTPYGARPTLTVRNVTDKRLFAFLTARGITPRAGGVVSGSALRLFPTEDFASTTFVIRRPAKGWTASSLKWSNRPDPGPTVVTHTAAGKKEQPFDIPITAEMAGWLSGAIPNNGLRIETTSTASAGRSFYSTNAQGTKARFQPVIVAQVSFPPAAPVDITPSGGAQVSVTDPIATWRYGGEGVSAMAAYQVQTFGSGEQSIPASSVMNKRFASFNYNGIVPATWNTRRAGVINTMWASGAKVFGCQEADSASSPGQAAWVLSSLNARTGSSGQWKAFIGENLNVIYIDGAQFNAVWSKAKSFHLGDNKYLVALLLEEKSTGVQTLFWTTHYLTSGELAKQVAHTRVALAVLADLAVKYRVPQIGTGDFNAKSKRSVHPMGMLMLAGHIDVRDLVEPEDITNGQYNSHDSYDPNGMNGWWIDHVLVSGGVTPKAVGLVDSGSSSDHNLVWADIEYVGSRPQVAGLGEPAHDTGEVASAVPQHQFTGITGPTAVRIRHKSIDNVWSAWSRPVTFGYTPLPMVTVTSTETSTNDPSPTTTWAVTGGTQAAFRVIYRRVDTGAVVADSKETPGADNQWQPPKPINVGQGVGLSREVRVWDTVTRAATVGAPAYAVGFGPVFTIDPSSIIAPVTALVVSTGPGPRVVLTWTRSATPDAFLVERHIGNRVTRQRFPVETGDAALGGGRYRWVDVTAPPEHDLTYRVFAVTNGAMGEAVVSDVTRLRSDFIWLADPDDPDWVLAMADDDPGSFSLPEQGAVIEVIGSDRKNIIHEGSPGYEGSVTGLFVDNVPDMVDVSAQAQRDKVWHIKRKPLHVWRLIVGDMNIPVRLREPTPVPRPGAEISFGISASFWQQGEIPWEQL